MNEKLQFSWGHIIAFLALIAFSYFSFVGFTYLTNGNFTFALIGMGVTDFVYVLFFLGAQQLKASGKKMKKKIVWERIFIFGSPIIFIVGMVSMSHFWTVRSQNSEIVETFTASINSGKQLFSDYEQYSNKRIEDYSKNLKSIIENKAVDPDTYQKAGFEDAKSAIQRDNMVKTLRIQLLSQNYDSLKHVANEWIDNASKGASTWNVFLLGNTEEIKDALSNWENQLKSFSAKEMSNESLGGKVPHFHSDGASKTIVGIDSLNKAFVTQKFPTFAAIIFGVIIYLMLLLPYILQERHTKNTNRLVGSEDNRPFPKKRKPSSDESEGLDLAENEDYPSF